MSFFQCLLQLLQSGRACCLSVPGVELSRTSSQTFTAGPKVDLGGKKEGKCSLYQPKNKGDVGSAGC